MTDEIAAVEAPETEQAPEEATEVEETSATPEEGDAQAVETPQAPVDPMQELSERLSKLDPKEFRRVINQNPSLAGVVGAEIQRAVAEREARDREEYQRQAKAKAEAELETLAREDPLAFTERWLSQTQRQKAQQQFQGVRGTARQEFATNIGRAVRELPEWGELSQDDHQELIGEVSGKNDDEALPVFIRKATQLVGRKVAQKMLNDWKAKELPKEREAIRAEERAKLLRATGAPDLEQPKGMPDGNPANLSDEEFTKWWNKRYK